MGHFWANNTSPYTLIEKANFNRYLDRWSVEKVKLMTDMSDACGCRDCHVTFSQPNLIRGCNNQLVICQYLNRYFLNIPTDLYFDQILFLFSIDQNESIGKSSFYCSAWTSFNILKFRMFIELQFSCWDKGCDCFEEKNSRIVFTATEYRIHARWKH